MYLAHSSQTTSSPIDIYCRSFAINYHREHSIDSVYEGEQPNREELLDLVKEIVVRDNQGGFMQNSGTLGEWQ